MQKHEEERSLDAVESEHAGGMGRYLGEEDAEGTGKGSQMYQSRASKRKVGPAAGSENCSRGRRGF